MARSYVSQNLVKRIELKPPYGERSYDRILFKF